MLSWKLLVLVYILSSYAAPGAALQRATSQGWVLRIETHHDESDTYSMKAYSGLSFVVDFKQPILLNGKPWPASEDKQSQIEAAVVLKRRGEVVNYQLGTSSSSHSLYSVTNRGVHDVDRWLSVLTDRIVPKQDRLVLLLVFNSNQTFADQFSAEQQFSVEFRSCTTASTCLTHVDGSAIAGNMTFQTLQPGFISYDVIDRKLDPLLDEQKTSQEETVPAVFEILRPKETMQISPKDYLLQTHEDTRNNSAPHKASPRYGDPDVADRLAVTYDAFIDLSNKEAPSDVDRAVSQGWKLAHEFHRGEASETSFLDVHETMKTEHAASVSTGFILFCVIEGFAPKAVKQGWDKMEQLMKKYLVPFVTDLLDGNPNDARPEPKHGGKRRLLSEDFEESTADNPSDEENVFLQVSTRKKGGQSGIAQDYGLLSIAITTDLLWSTPAIVDAISTPFTTLAAQQVFSAVIETVRAPIEREVPTAVGNMVKKTVPMTVGYVIPIAIKRLLPGYCLQALANTVTNVLTRALTHSLTDTLQHTLTRDSALEISCYKCKYMKTHCETCFDGKDQHRQFTAGYYSNWYASYYSDYYGYFFTRGEGVLRDDHPHLFKFIETFVGVAPYPYKHEHIEHDHEPNWYTGLRMDE